MSIEVYYGIYFRDDLWEAHDISCNYGSGKLSPLKQPNKVIESIEHILTHIQRSK